jgi:hypothetical protein
MNNHMDLGRISSVAADICSSEMDIPLIGQSLNNENWYWCKESEDEQNESKVYSSYLDTDYVSRQKTSGLRWSPFLPFVLRKTSLPHLLEPVGVDINYCGQ